MKYCTYCGTEMDQNAAFCPECGKPTQAPAEAAQPEVQHIHVHHHEPIPEPSRKNGLGVAGFVLSLISIVLACIPLVGLIGLITDIPGFCLALAGLLKGIFKKKKLGLSIAALILSIIAVVMMVTWVNQINNF